MASSSTFEFLVLWQSMFIGMLVFFGMTTTTFQSATQAPLNVLLGPFLDFNALLSSQGYTGIKNCGILDGNCNASNIQNATIFVGTAIAYGMLLGFQVLQKIGAAITLVFALATALGSDFGIPYLGYIETAFIVWTILYGIAVIKPGGHGT